MERKSLFGIVSPPRPRQNQPEEETPQRNQQKAGDRVTPSSTPLRTGGGVLNAVERSPQAVRALAGQTTEQRTSAVEGSALPSAQSDPLDRRVVGLVAAKVRASRLHFLVALLVDNLPDERQERAKRFSVLMEDCLRHTTQKVKSIHISESSTSSVERRVAMLREYLTESEGQRRARLVELTQKGEGGPNVPIDDPSQGQQDSLNIIFIDDSKSKVRRIRDQYFEVLNTCSTKLLSLVLRGDPHEAESGVGWSSTTPQSSNSKPGTGQPSAKKARKEEEPSPLNLDEGWEMMVAL